MSDTCSQVNFTNRLETFVQYSGVVDPILLSRNGFYHVGNNIIRCNNCRTLFISWISDENFWNKHREEVCNHINKDFTYWGDKEHNQTIDGWLHKDYMKTLIKLNIISESSLRLYITEFLRQKGDDATIRLFKEYLYFMKYFCNHFNLDI